MPISSLVITLQPTAEPADAALSLRSALPWLLLGPACGPRLPAVIDMRSLQQCRQAVESLQAHPTVAFVDVVGVQFEDVEG